MNLLKITITTLLIACCTMTAMSQKFGYLNSQQLLVELPEIKQADDKLIAHQKTLVAKGEQMVKSFETKYTAYVEEANKGTLSQIQMQQKEAELGKEQQAIQQYELEVQQELAKKREELYKPILDKVKVAVEQVGKANGYTMIFDTSLGSLLHANESDDVMALVKSQLGI